MKTLTTRLGMNRVVMMFIALSLAVGYVALANNTATGAVVAGTFDTDINVQRNASGVAITWVTDTEEDGDVIYSIDPDTALGSTAVDDRGVFPGTRLNLNTHHVIITGVPGGSTINYNIRSGGVSDPNGPYQVTIPSTALTTPGDLLTGTVEYPDTSSAVHCVISARVVVIDATQIFVPPFPFVNHNSLWVTTLTNGGQFTLDIQNVRQDPTNTNFSNNNNTAFSFDKNNSKHTVETVARCDGDNAVSTPLQCRI